MAEKPSADLGEPPSVAALSMAETATTHATEQQIDPWSVRAATGEQGSALAFGYEAISQKWNTKLIDKDLLERFERVTARTAGYGATSSSPTATSTSF